MKKPSQSLVNRQRRELGQYIEQKRLARNLKVKQVADEVGVHAYTVRLWEIGGSRPHPIYLHRLADAIGADLTQLSLLADTIPERRGRNPKSKSERIRDIQIGQRIRQARLEAGMTHRLLAKICGLRAASSIVAWETGYVHASPERLAMVADATGVSPHYLATGDRHAD